jgi:hypothetical protein
MKIGRIDERLEACELDRREAHVVFVSKGSEKGDKAGAQGTRLCRHNCAVKREVARHAPGARMAPSYHSHPVLPPIKSLQKWTKFAALESKLLQICKQFRLRDK